jgi:hypothetical protein
VIYDEAIDEAPLHQFERELDGHNLSVKLRKLPTLGPFAGIEWLLPTALMVIIAKPYFDSFLNEAGKDHYHILKKYLTKLGSKYTGKDAPRGEYVYSEGKALSTRPRYSPIFSIYGEISTHLRLKLLIEPTITPENLESAVDAFILALTSIQNGACSSHEIAGIEEATDVGGTILVTYDITLSKLVVVNPMPRQSEDTRK